MPSGLGTGNEKKEGVTEDQAFEVWQRDNEHCPLCGRGLAESPAPHHIFFKSRYHGDDRDENWNLAPLCMSCHKKFDGNPEELDKRLKEVALERYQGSNRQRLLEIYQNKFGEKYAKREN